MLNELLRHIKTKRLEAEREKAAARIARVGGRIRAAGRLRKVAPTVLSTPMSRASILKELNAILATRATPQGFVVTFPEYLFDHQGLRSTSLDKLAHMARLLRAQPGIPIAAEVQASKNSHTQHSRIISCRRMFEVIEYFVTHGVLNLYIPARGSADLEPCPIENRRNTRPMGLIANGKALAKARGAAAAA